MGVDFIGQLGESRDGKINPVFTITPESLAKRRSLNSSYHPDEIAAFTKFNEPSRS
jgi:hypothetical protein